MCSSPHRDLVDLAGEPAAERAGRRVHIVLHTSVDSLFSEDEKVFRMKFGEVWFPGCHKAAQCGRAV